MTHEEKINYMRMAMSIVGYKFEETGLDMLVSMYDLVNERKGETDLDSICAVEQAVKERAVKTVVAGDQLAPGNPVYIKDGKAYKAEQ